MLHRGNVTLQLDFDSTQLFDCLTYASAIRDIDRNVPAYSCQGFLHVFGVPQTVQPIVANRTCKALWGYLSQMSGVSSI